jgi:hypothetical protein
MKKLQIIIIALIVFLSIFALASGQVKAQALSIRLNPTSGHIGDTVTVSGSGFTANQMIGIKFDSAYVNTLPASINSGTGSFSATFSVPNATTGSHTVTALDGLNENAQTSFEVVKATPTVPAPTLNSSGSTTMGNSVSLSVTISGAGAVPSGTATFQAKIGSGSFSTISAVSLNSGGSASATYIPQSVGNYQFQVIYSGDSNYAGATSSAASLTVNKGTALVGAATFSPSSPILLGTSITVSVSVTSPNGATAPTGNVQFQVSNGSGFVNFGSLAALVGGSASISYKPASATTYSFDAVYQGDSNYVTGTTGVASVPLTVNKLTPTVSAPTLNPSGSTTVGTSVSLSVTVVGVTGFTPSGTATFQVKIGEGSYSDIGLAVTLSGGSASTTYTPQSAGSYQFQVVYSGDSNYTLLTGSAASLTVNKGSALVGAATFSPASPIGFGSSVTVSVSVTSPNGTTAPTGNVQFQVSINGGGFANFGSLASLLGGSASNSYTPSTATTYNFKAVYQGDSNYASGTIGAASVTLTVKDSLTVSVSPTTGILDVGQNKVFTAAAGGGSGSYTSYQWYVNGAAQIGQTASTFSYSAISSGSYSITVSVTDTFGATSPQSTASLVTVSASPTVNIAPVGPITLDLGQVQVFDATVSGGSGVIHYQWYNDGAVVGTDSSSYSYTATGSSHSITCTVTDSASTPVTSPVSNAVSVTVSSSTQTPGPSSGSTPTPTPKSSSTATPSSTSKPSPTPTPSGTNVTATTSNGTTVNLVISGNVTSSQISNAAITSSQSTKTTTVSFTVKEPSGTTGFGNMTIPKAAVSNGISPVVYIDSQQSSNQGYTEDANNFYVWYTTNSGTHQISIQFEIPSTSKASSLPIIFVGVTVAEIISIFTIISVRRLRQKSSN